MARKMSLLKRFKTIWQEYRNMIIFMSVIVIISLIIIALQPFLIKLINSNPKLSEIYYHALLQVTRLSLLWLFIATFLGSLFFISVPSEFIFLYYIFSGANPVYTVVVAFFGIMLGRSLDFLFGSIFRRYTLKSIIGRKKDFKKRFRKIESSLVFFGNFIPIFPMELFTVFIGTTKYPYWKYLAYNGSSKLIKLVIMAIFIKYFMFYEANILSFQFFDFVKGIMEFILSIIKI